MPCPTTFCNAGGSRWEHLCASVCARAHIRTGTSTGTGTGVSTGTGTGVGTGVRTLTGAHAHTAVVVMGAFEGGPEAEPSRNAGERLSKALEGSTVTGVGGCGQMQERVHVQGGHLRRLTGAVNAFG